MNGFGLKHAVFSDIFIFGVLPLFHLNEKLNNIDIMLILFLYSDIVGVIF